MMASLFRSWDFFLVRMPLLAAADASTASPDVARMPVEGRPAYQELLRALSADALLREAVDIATPTLSAAWEDVAAGHDDRLTDAQLRRAALAVLRYRLRMHSRATPFGLFAGVCIGEFGSTPRFIRGSKDRTRTLADTGWLLKVLERLEADPDVLKLLRVRRHQAVTVRGDRVMIEAPVFAALSGNKDGRSAVSMRNTPVVQKALRLSQVPIQVAELAMLLDTEADDAPDARVLGLLRLLVRENFLLTELRPPLDGGDPLKHVLSVLDSAGKLPERAARIREELQAVDRVRQNYNGAAPGTGHELIKEFRRRADLIQRHGNPLQVDTRLDVSVQLPEEVRSEIERMAEMLWRLSAPTPGIYSLRPYHGRFIERYGVDRLVPLTTLLDDNQGLGSPDGYQSRGFRVPADETQQQRDMVRDIALSRLVACAARDRRREIVLDEATIRDLCPGPADEGQAQESCELCVHVVAPSPEQLAAGAFRVVLAAGPGSHRAGSAFGRFAGLLPEWRERLADEARMASSASETMTAELAFAPRSHRTANLANATPYAGRRITVGLPDSGLAEEISVLDVAVGGDQERLYAIHLPTRRQVVPTLPSMINVAAQAPYVCRLLYEIGREGQRLWQPWTWGPFKWFPFLPRIRYGRSVLASATWRMDDLRRHPGDWSSAVNRWRSDWRVPRHVLVGSNDRQITLDLADPWHREILRDELRKDQSLSAHEIPGGSDEWRCHGIAGQATEIVVPLVRRSPTPYRKPYIGFIDPQRGRDGASGEWLSLNIHCSPQTQDAFLRENVPLMVKSSQRAGVERWFFIRYKGRGRPHIRLRFHGPLEALSRVLSGEVTGMLEEWQRAGLVGPYQVHQYDPELERYGGSGAQDAVELLFQHDSAAALAALRLVREPGFPYPIDTLAVISIGSMAQAVASAPGPAGSAGAGRDENEDAARWLSITGTRRELPEDYRRQMMWWQHLIDPAGGWPELSEDEHGTRVLAALRDRDDAMRAFATRIKAASPTPLDRAVGSLMHMTCNRLIGTSREREFKIMGIARGAVQDNAKRRSNPVGRIG